MARNAEQLTRKIYEAGNVRRVEELSDVQITLASFASAYIAACKHFGVSQADAIGAIESGYGTGPKSG